MVGATGDRWRSQGYGPSVEYSAGACASGADPWRFRVSLSIGGLAPDRLEGVVEDPVRGVLAHLDPGGIGEPEMDAEPDPGVDDRAI
jgi:hypothetical protein